MTEEVDEIILYYQMEYRNKYNIPYIPSRNKLHNLLSNILKDLSVEDIKKLIDFYLETERSPSLLVFCYEYDQVFLEMKKQETDLAYRKSLLSETQKKVEEFRRRYGAG